MDVSKTDIITVRAFKHDGSEHRSWLARVLRVEGPLVVLSGEFESEVQHQLLGTIPSGTLSIEYYWLDRWYNIFRFHRPDGKLRNYYCNVNVPPEFDGETLKYVDLDIDILVNSDFSYQILDLDEFERHANLYGYSEEIRANAMQAVLELEALIEHRSFPLNE